MQLSAKVTRRSGRGLPLLLRLKGHGGFKQRGHRAGAVDVVSGSKQKSGRELMLAWPGGREAPGGWGVQLMDLLMPRMWAWRKEIDRWPMPRFLAGREDISWWGSGGEEDPESEWGPN